MQNVEQLVQKQRTFFLSGKTQPVSFRRRQLCVLEDAIKSYESAIFDALQKDLGKSDFESFASEVGMVLKELRFAIKHVSSWARPKRVRSSLVAWPASSRIHYEPYGVCVLLSPWNFPFQLAIAPLVAAIASGNCTVLKPSEHAPNTTATIIKMIEEAFEPDYITALTGGNDLGQSLTEQKVDLIYFCGNPVIGKLVMKQAAQNLTPVLLELGGKNPCIVAKDADIKTAARRITWGKFLNCGQTCVAPDYLLVEADIKNDFLAEMQKTITEFYGHDPGESPDYPRIINAQHFDRLTKLIASNKPTCGGESRIEDLYIAPTIIDHIDWQDELMTEEIFGPILPIIEYTNTDHTIEQINSRPSPLALYLFTKNTTLQKQITTQISFGGGCINDTALHYVNPRLPFGGVGQSGIGSYHGHSGFLAFSNQKSILKKSTMLDFKLRYPPYKSKLNLLRKLF